MSTADAWTRNVSAPPRAVATIPDVAPAPVPIAVPDAPAAGVTAVEALPTFLPHRHASVWFVGAHGGAGESTLASLLPMARAADHRWPVDPRTVVPAQVVLVARTHTSGLLAAQSALQQWAAGGVRGVELLGLVLSADVPGRLPRPLRDLERLVAGGAPRVWRLPYLEAWRLGEPEVSDVANVFGRITSLIPVR